MTTPQPALVRTFRESAGRAVATLTRVFGDIDLAEDAVQEAFHTFLELPQARELVDSAAESRALLAAIVRNAARNLRRRHHRDRPHLEIAEDADAAAA